MKSEVDKLDINELVNDPIIVNNLKTKVDDLDVGKLKTVPIDLKNLSYVVSKEVVKNTEFNTRNTMLQLVSVATNATVATNLIHINQYNTEK